MKTIVICLLIVAYVSISSCRMIVIKDVQMCDPNKKYPLTLVVKRKYEGETLLQDWTFGIGVPFSDKLGWSIVGSRVYGNKTKKLVDIKNKNGGGCTTFMTHAGEKVRAIANYADVPWKCPVTKNPVHVKWYDFDVDIDLAKLVPKGSYVTTMKFFDDATEVACVVGYFDKI